MKNKLFAALVLTLLCALNSRLTTAHAQGTAFMYQGHLVNAGIPATGLYDVQFTLYPTNVAGNASAGPVTNSATLVSNGLFTATIDFGPGVFTGTNYWLDLAVRTNGAVTFTELTPRQPILPTPYAIFAKTASNLIGTLSAGQISGTVASANLSGTYGNALTLNNAGNSLSGNGANLTSLNANNLASGTVSLAQLSGITSNQLNATTWQLATNLNGGSAALASNVVSGITITNAFITNSVFAGNGSGLTNLNASQLNGSVPGVVLTSVPAANLTGTVPLAQLPAAVITNTETGISLSGSFAGNGGGLTNLNTTTPSVINANSITIGATNVIAPLTVPPKVPIAAIGSISLDSLAYSIAVAGRYVYVASYFSNILQVVDVSIPANPILVGSVATGNYPISLAVAGRYAYVVNYGSGTLQIFDVSNPSGPTFVGSVGASSPYSVAVAGRYAYVLGNGLQIFDVSNPSGPTLVGQVAAGGTCVAVAGRYAFVVNGGLQIFDVSNPASPMLAGSVALGNNFNPVSVAVAGRYAYVANISAALQIIDVSNPASPLLVNPLNGDTCCLYPGVYVAVAGRFAFVLNEGAFLGGNSMNIFDVSNPANPLLTGSLAMSGNPVNVVVAGRYAYVTFFSGSLQVFDLGGAYIQQLEAGAMETGTLQTRDTVTVGNNLDVRGGLTVSGSARITGGLNLGGVTTNTVVGGHTFYITNGIIMNFQ